MISVVIPAYNSAKTITEAIKGVFTQTITEEMELIIVDDGSTDATAQIIKSFPKVKYFYQGNAGPAAARNRGARESKGDIIFFTDSDCVPHNDWIEGIRRYFSDPKIAVVSGTYDLVEGSNLLAKCIHQEIIFRHQRRMPEYPKSFGSYNFCIRKKVFDQVGGFDTRYRTASGEDNDLSYKILSAGHRIYFARDARVKHHHPSDVKKYLREQFNHGFWRVKMYRDHPQMMKGDDYTFWKDIAEPPLVLGVILSGILAPFFGTANLVFIVLIFMVLIVEIIYGFLYTRSFFSAIFWAAIMLLRAWARTLGFLFGLPHFFLKKTPKKLK